MTDSSRSVRAEVAAGLRDSWTVGLGLIPLGLAFGLLVVQMGFAWWWAPIFSFVIYAGSMEFLALGLVTAGTGWLSALVTGFLVNFRHIFYGLTYPRHRIRSRVGKAYATYALTDEVYAITGRFGADGRGISGARLLTITAFCQALWIIPGMLGALGGTALQIDLEGLDFALTALFVVLALEAFDNNRDVSLVVSAVILALLAAAIAPGQLLIFALCAYFGVLLVRYHLPRLDERLTWRPLGRKED